MASKDLAEMLKKKSLTPNPSPKGRGDTGAGVERDPLGALPVAEVAEEETRQDASSTLGVDDLVAMVCEQIEQIEVEAVVNGCLQRIRFKAGMNPASVGPSLKALDPGCKLRDDFPARGSFGKKDAQAARVVFINVRCANGGKFIDMGCQNGDEFKVGVTKKNADGFIDLVAGLGKVSERNMTKLRKAISEQGEAIAMLTEPEQFGVKYWTSDDGKHFMESIEAAAPVIVAEVKE